MATVKREHQNIEIDNNHLYVINGIKVCFPVKPYPTQITMMNKIIQGLERKQNCLLESPTGSGKSLALLCSCLAWQEAEKKRITEAEEAVESRREANDNDNNVDQDYQDVNQSEVSEVIKNKNKENDDQNESDDDFVEGGIKKNTKKKSNELLKEQEIWKMELNEHEKKKSKEGVCEMQQNEDGEMKREKVAKIYFGTRTHKQIKQIIRELRKTVYKNARMSILGSREFLCIHPKVSKGGDKNEECKKLVKGMEGGSCRFHTNYSVMLKHNVREKYKLNEAWDIEDLVAVGKKIKACPYFGSRELTKGADIVFCPYNYLVDPLIRDQMSINVKNQIIILDEAHNIEDTARDSASISLTMIQLEETQKDLQDIINAGIMVDAHSCLKMLIDGIIEWMEQLKPHLEKKGFESEAKVWNGNEISKMLSEKSSLKLNQASLKIYGEQMQKLAAVDNDNNGFGGEQEAFKLTSKSLTVLEHLLFILGKVLYEEVNYAQDYRVVLTRTSVFMPKNLQLPGGWLKKSKQLEKVWTYKLNFWCMNPAVVFSELGETSRCVILSSGTLSPMTSFSSELGVKFPITLEANHVIADSQVWVGNLTVGPTNSPINANYRSSETFTFQDSVGHIICNICKVVSKGVLCFFPSYSMMEKLMRRWKSTSMWQELSMYKVVLSEPRGGDKHEFDDTLQQYYDSISSSNENQDGSNVTGALLLAVCRGKVSEGLDFSDDNARAVITIGIPFPNFKDLQVELKRKYNTEHSVNKSLLNGSDWYDIQAFRALNQALGRCIRHKSDWGALLIVDERFSKSPKYRNGLSKWVRNKVRLYQNFQSCLSGIAEFADRHSKSSRDSKCVDTTEQNIQSILYEQGSDDENMRRISTTVNRSPEKQNASKYFNNDPSTVNLYGFTNRFSIPSEIVDNQSKSVYTSNNRSKSVYTSINQSKSVYTSNNQSKSVYTSINQSKSVYTSNNQSNETNTSIQSVQTNKKPQTSHIQTGKKKFNFQKTSFTSLSSLSRCDQDQLDDLTIQELEQFDGESIAHNSHGPQVELVDDLIEIRMNLYGNPKEEKSQCQKTSDNINLITKPLTNIKKNRFSYPLSKHQHEVDETKPMTSSVTNQKLIANLSNEFKKRPIDLKSLNHFKKEMKNKKQKELTPLKSNTSSYLSSTPLVSKTFPKKSPVGSPVLFDNNKFDDCNISKIFQPENEIKRISNVEINDQMPIDGDEITDCNHDNEILPIDVMAKDDEDFEKDFKPLNRSVKRKKSDTEEESKKKATKINSDLDCKSDVKDTAKIVGKSSTSPNVLNKSEDKNCLTTNSSVKKNVLGVRRSRKRNVRMTKPISMDGKYRPITDDIDINKLAKQTDDEKHSLFSRCKSCKNVYQVSSDTYIHLPKDVMGICSSAKLYKMVDVTNEENFTTLQHHHESKGLNAHYDTDSNKVYMPLYCRVCVGNETCIIGVKCINVKQGTSMVYLLCE